MKIQSCSDAILGKFAVLVFVVGKSIRSASEERIRRGSFSGHARVRSCNSVSTVRRHRCAIVRLEVHIRKRQTLVSWRRYMRDRTWGWTIEAVTMAVTADWREVQGFRRMHHSPLYSSLGDDQFGAVVAGVCTCSVVVAVACGFQFVEIVVLPEINKSKNSRLHPT